MPKDNENADKTAENSAKNAKESPKINLAIIKEGCENMKKNEPIMRYLVGFFWFTDEEAVEMSVAKALEIDDIHKRHFRTSRKKWLDKGDGSYERILAYAGTCIVAVDKICEVRGEIMLRSDLNRIAASDLFLPQNAYELKQAVDLATLMLPLPLPKH